MRLYTRWLNLSQNLLLDVTNLWLFFSVQYSARHWIFPIHDILVNYFQHFIGSLKKKFLESRKVKHKNGYSLNLNQSKSTDYQWNLTDSNS